MAHRDWRAFSLRPRGHGGAETLPLATDRAVPTFLWPKRGHRAAPVRICRHDKQDDLPQGRNRRTAVLARENREDRHRGAEPAIATSYSPRPSPPSAQARNGGPTASSSARISSQSRPRATRQTHGRSRSRNLIATLSASPSPKWRDGALAHPYRKDRNRRAATHCRRAGRMAGWQASEAQMGKAASRLQKP